MAIKPIRPIMNIEDNSGSVAAPKQRHNLKSKNFSISLPHELYEQAEEYKFMHRKRGISQVIQEALTLLFSQQLPK